MAAEAIAGRRDQVFLVSKVLPSNASYEGTLRACERSLRRLKTDWLNLYCCTGPASHPITDTMRATEKLVAEGLVRFIGLSNFDVEELKEAERALKNEQMACNWVLLSSARTWNRATPPPVLQREENCCSGIRSVRTWQFSLSPKRWWAGISGDCQAASPHS